MPVRHDPASGRFLPAGASGGPAHGVGVTDPNDPTSLVNRAGGQRPGESAADYHDRIFREGEEHYTPCATLEVEATEYRDALHLPDPKVQDWAGIEAPLDRLESVGDAFAQLQSNPADPHVIKAYRDLVDQTKAQWQHLTGPESEGGQGVKVEFVTQKDLISRGIDAKGLNPYKTAADQAHDISANKHLMIASISDWPQSHHPLLDNSLGGEYDTFRAVHDAFGHAAIGADFSRHGEFQAWLHHSSMFTGDARRAASTELTGENSYLVSHHHAATHKAALLPDPLIAMPWDSQGNLIPNFWLPNGQTATMASKAATATRGADGPGLAEVIGFDVPDPATATGADLALLDNGYARTGTVNPHDALHGEELLRRTLEGQDNLVAAAAGMTGAMVAALPQGALPVTDDVGLAHVTLVYLGSDASEIDDDTRAAIDAFIAHVAAEHDPITATVAGAGTLGTDGAVVLLLNSDTLAAAHEDLQFSLEGAQLCGEWSHDGFIPHLSLSYDGDVKDPDVVALIGTTITFDRLATVYGGEEHHFRLGVPTTAELAVGRFVPATAAFPVRHAPPGPGGGRFIPGEGEENRSQKLLPDVPTVAAPAAPKIGFDGKHKATADHYARVDKRVAELPDSHAAKAKARSALDKAKAALDKAKARNAAGDTAAADEALADAKGQISTATNLVKPPGQTSSTVPGGTP